MIPAKQDAFGQAVCDFYQGKEAVEIIERDDGYIGTSGGPAAYFVPFEEWSAIPPTHLAYHERNRQRDRIAGQVRIRVRYKTFIGPWFDYLMVSPDEMAKIVSGTGWEIAEIYKAEESGSYTAIIAKTSS